MKQLPMRSDMFHSYYDAVQPDFDSIQHYAMEKNMMHASVSLVLWYIIFM